MGVPGREIGRPGLVLALEGGDDRPPPPPACLKPGLSPTLHLRVASDIGLVRREEGLDGV